MTGGKRLQHTGCSSMFMITRTLAMDLGPLYIHLPNGLFLIGLCSSSLGISLVMCFATQR